jgi:hypothetical protein
MYHGLTRTALILTVTPASVAVAAPLTAYGVVGSTQSMWNGSDSGVQGMAWAHSKDWVFHAVQVGPVAPSGYTVSIYGSNDPRCFVPSSVGGRADLLDTGNGIQGSQYGSPYIVTPTGRDQALRLPIGTHVQNGDVLSVPANSWVLLPGPSDQVGTGVDVNPIISVGQMFHAKRCLLSVRAVLTASAGAVGSMAICITAC